MAAPRTSRERQDPVSARPRSVTSTRFPRDRVLVTQAMRVGRSKAPIYGILELDVTAARAKLAAMDPPGSTTAYIVKAVGVAASHHPMVHAYRDWQRRLIRHSHVDVATMLEVQRPEGPIPMAHTIRDADARSVADISSELRRLKAHPEKTRGWQLFSRLVPLVSRIPGLVLLFYRVLAKSKRAREISGTVSVTSVGMFGGGGGVGITPPTIQTLGILVGGISRRPVVVGDSIAIRDVMDLTVTVDHNIVDGAPAARFVAELRSLIETAEILP